MNKEKIFKKAGPVLAVLAVGFLLFKVFGLLGGLKNCQTLTPMALQRFYMTTSVKPVYGEKCQLDKEMFVIRLAYNNSGQAEEAIYAFKVGTQGEEQVGAISYQGDTASFFQKGRNLAIVVLLGEDTASDVEKALDKVDENKVFKGFAVPKVDLDEIEDEFFPEDELSKTETKPKEEEVEEWKKFAKKETPKISPSPKPSPKASPKKKEVSGTLPSKWVFPGSEAYRSEIVLKDDGSFTFTGLTSRDFKSGGKYTFNRNILTLTFTQDKAHWQNYFKDGATFVSYYDDILEVNAGDPPSATFDIYKCGEKYGSSSCINFFNWLYRRQ